jgi:predicted PurR-regulated permease PerM
MDDFPKGRVFGMRAEERTDSTTPKKIPIWDKKTVRALTTIITFAAIAAFCYGAWKVIVAFLFSIFLAYLLDPLVWFVQRKSKLSAGSRSRAITQVYVLLGIILAVLIIVAGPKLQSEGKRLTSAAPIWMDQLTTGKIALQVGIKHGWSLGTQEQVQHWLMDHRQDMVHWAGRLGSYAAGLVVNSIWLVIVPILAVFFLRDGRSFADSLIEVVDRRRQRQFLSALLDDLDTMLARYIRAQLILAALTMVVFTVVLTVMRLPYSVVLGVTGGVLEFIPVVGPLVAAATIFAVAIFTAYPHPFVVLIFLGAWRLIQDYVTAPRLMGRSVELHPLAALFAILSGAEIAGVIGVYLSIPVAATLRIFWRRWRTYSAISATTVDTEPPARRLTG